MFSDYFKAWSNAMLATQVVVARMPILYMLAVDPTPGRQREAELMFSEKQEALVEGLVAAHHIACQNMADMMLNRHNGTSVFTNYMDALTKPAERILKANAKRLGK
ncbi:hypothetical protein [Aquisalinus flavus]|uniref:Uncharacterized protein n=1 Tax=Aquisalinus flavus TaxID=1526572 RepID=A0A8J2Y833_9PROT|nr:hypothetical protein [Aquisalinus flavus]MBD0425845.1 hypothetical protein [Aquisalinus flavus]UNE48554.1 hypothetical protein FF099_11090 [Aquisalinus flavus]GGD12789.1 hypothetical protein GCM10011342_21970 [Aquisalinus flavus]